MSAEAYNALVDRVAQELDWTPADVERSLSRLEARGSVRRPSNTGGAGARGRYQGAAQRYSLLDILICFFTKRSTT